METSKIVSGNDCLLCDLLNKRIICEGLHFLIEGLNLFFIETTGSVLGVNDLRHLKTSFLALLME
jgi:hypothetical protein